jgi:hypothetical protein
MREGSPPLGTGFLVISLLENADIQHLEERCTRVSQKWGSLTFFGSYAKFSVVGLTNVVVDYGTLNLLLLLFPTRDHNPQPRLVKRVFEMEY